MSSKLLIRRFICYKQHPTQMPSLNLFIAFPVLIKVQHISRLSWKKPREPPSVLCSSASVLVFKALVAQDTPQIAPHLISSLSLRYLPRHHWAANGRWAAASVPTARARTRKHGRRSLNHALTTWSVPSPPLPPAPSPSISLAAAYRWGHKLIIGMSSEHNNSTTCIHTHTHTHCLPICSSQHWVHPPLMH